MEKLVIIVFYFIFMIFFISFIYLLDCNPEYSLPSGVLENSLPVGTIKQSGLNLFCVKKFKVHTVQRN